MSKAVQQQVNKLFEATKDLTTFAKIKPHCEVFNQWLKENTSYSPKSLGTVLSRVGFYKKFKSIGLEQGKNADYIVKQDGSHELKHYAVILCGLSDEEWAERNQTTRVSDRLSATDEDGNAGVEIDPDKYLEVTANLLASDNPHELAVGLIAATGRRPHEILARAEFNPVEGEPYQLMFSGQGKKRGQQPVFQISTLFPASYIIERLNHLHKDTSIKQLLNQVTNEFPDDISAQNKAIEDKRGNSLRRVVQEYFGGKRTPEPLLNFRHGEEQSNCKALRAACASLVTQRDRPGSVGAKMLFYGTFLGHLTPGSKPSDAQLRHLVTSLGYADYYVTKPVSYPPVPNKERDCSLRISATDLEFINLLRQQLDLPNHKAVTAKLIESYKNTQLLVQQLQSANETIAQLEKQINDLQATHNQLPEIDTEVEQEKQMSKVTQITETQVNLSDLQQIIQKMVDEAVDKALQAKSFATTTAKAVQPKQQIDWQAKTDAEVWGSKAPMAVLEKIRRSFIAICLYNDTIATNNCDRLAVTNQALRDLSGCNGLLVRDWIEQHKDELISHNAKYGMENKKDPQNPASYANKAKDTDKILSLVNEKFLSGEGYRKAKSK